MEVNFCPGFSREKRKATTKALLQQCEDSGLTLEQAICVFKDAISALEYNAGRITVEQLRSNLRTLNDATQPKPEDIQNP